MFGKRYPNCVKKKKSEGKLKEGGVEKVLDMATKNLPSRPTDLKGQVLEGSDPDYVLGFKLYTSIKAAVWELSCHSVLA